MVELPRTAVTYTDAADGLLLRLGQTKDDPRNRTEVVRQFSFTGPVAPVADALAQYLAVRDAAVGLDGPLVLSGKRGFPGPAIPPADHWSARVIQRLADAAGLEGRYSGYSTRRGYAAQAEVDGWDIERTQNGLRHSAPDTTMRYISLSSNKSSAKLARLLVADGGHQ